MATIAPRKQERLEVRVSAEVKEMIEYAANLRGETLTAFAIRALSREAEEAITTHQVIRLTMEQSRAFIAALEGDHEPNEHLKKAIADYAKLVSEDALG